MVDRKKESSGEIWVNKFTEDSATQFRESLLLRSRHDQDVPIVVHIDSYGGYVDSLAKMIETMDEIPNPIITACVGKAMSCGAILLSHGDYRYCGPHSRILIHEVSSGTGGDVHDMHNDATETKRLNKHFMGLLAKNCGIKGGYEGLRQLVKEHDGRDIYLTGDRAVEFGIVDEVGTPTLVPYVGFELVTTPVFTKSQRKKRAIEILGLIEGEE